MNNPFVSIIIPTFNRESTIRRTVDSALGQTYPFKEVIVVDDGSTDGTQAILKSYCQKIRVVLQPNAGPSAARNHGFRKSRGDIIAFLDSDDTWLPEKIERQVALLMSGGDEVVCCVCDAELREADGSIRFSFQNARLRVAGPSIWQNPGEVLATRFILFNQVAAIRRSAFAAVEGFNESLHLLEDYDIAMRLSQIGRWGILPEALVIKFNDTVGIGVQAMQNKTIEVRAARNVIEILLATAFSDSNSDNLTRTRLISALRNIQDDQRALKHIDSASYVRVFWGRALIVWYRLFNWLRRRLAGRVNIELKPLSSSRPSLTF